MPSKSERDAHQHYLLKLAEGLQCEDDSPGVTKRLVIQRLSEILLVLEATRLGMTLEEFSLEVDDE